MNDGGPASPGLNFEFDKELHADAQWPYTPVPFGGMSIRDYFAGQALPPIIDSMQTSPRSKVEEAAGSDGFVGTGSEYAAFVAYKYADAMLVEREKKSDDDE